MEQLGLIFGGVITADELRARDAPLDAGPRRAARQSENVPRARRNDPTTSRAAANRAKGFAVSHRNRIMAALREGPGNIFEISKRSGIDHVAVARRMIELQRDELAEPTDEKREGARVWRARQ